MLNVNLSVIWLETSKMDTENFRLKLAFSNSIYHGIQWKSRMPREVSYFSCEEIKKWIMNQKSDECILLISKEKQALYKAQVGSPIDGLIYTGNSNFVFND